MVRRGREGRGCGKGREREERVWLGEGERGEGVVRGGRERRGCGKGREREERVW